MVSLLQEMGMTVEQIAERTGLSLFVKRSSRILRRVKQIAKQTAKQKGHPRMMPFILTYDFTMKL
ncbi:MAG: hypothetical protein HC827_14770 [Cyanobacteria bacterium RM1_2_2]|nr:hypothetical protein [Cyanobacteria bacterium RM1_2_2]